MYNQSKVIKNGPLTGKFFHAASSPVAPVLLTFLPGAPYCQVNLKQILDVTDTVEPGLRVESTVLGNTSSAGLQLALLAFTS